MSQASYDYVVDRYGEAIDYYWRRAATNKRAYKWTRYLTVVLGGLVTLMAALGSATFVERAPEWKTAFAICTPVAAFLLTVLGGFAQSFQWGAAWREMALTAERIEKQRDRIRVTSPEETDPAEDLELLNEIILTESHGFFDRILGRTQGRKLGGSGTIQ